MVALPQPERTTPKLIYEVFEKRAKPWLSRRLGGSAIGKACERAVWYGFRWASAGKPSDGRMLRLRETGNEQEGLLCTALRAGGVELYTEQPGAERTQQIEYDGLGGHVVVYLDGIGRGFPEAPAKWHILSLKLANAKRWKGIRDKGLEAAEPVYHAQSQLEMHLSGVDRTLLLVRNRDTEELHVERVRYSPAAGDALLAKAGRVIASDRPPARIHEDPEHFECRFCDHASTCHGKALPAPNCRNCLHATPHMDGKARWSCAVRKCDLMPKEQEAGCPSHVYIPDLLAGWARVEDATETGVVFVNDLSGHRFENGPHGLPSVQLHAFGDAHQLVGEPDIEGLRTRMGAEVVAA